MAMPADSKALYEQLLQNLVDLIWVKMQGLADETWESQVNELQVRLDYYNQMNNWNAMLTASQGA